MPSFNPPGAVLLDVTLRREGIVKRWTISSEPPEHWSCRFVNANTVTVSGCSTVEKLIVTEREWRAEIEAARADGWS